MDSFGRGWSDTKADQLQAVFDDSFVKHPEVSELEFSFTLADPMQEDCPLVACSSGFSRLVGYHVTEIVGRNCRFLIEPVPPNFVDLRARRHARDFCEAAREGKVYTILPDEAPSWLPPHRVSDHGLFCIQTNARKDGTLFKNCFYLKRIELDDKPYIVGLQTEIPFDYCSQDVPLQLCHSACRCLEENMAAAERALAKLYWYTAPMRRQDDLDLDDGFDCSGTF